MLTVGEAVAQVQAAAVPAGVDPRLFDELRQELIRVLRETSKAAAVAPHGSSNAVDDLLVAANDVGGWRLEWTYRNVGDYNRDGMVSINDLTPVGQSYNMTQYDLGWCRGRYADGNADGAVTLGDITPIGQHYSAFVAGYRIYGADVPGGPWTLIDEIDLPAWSGSGARVVGYQLASLAYAFYRVEPIDGGGVAGESSAASRQSPEPAAVAFGSSTVLLTQTVDAAGGTLSGVPATPLERISVAFPAGAVPDDTQVTLGYNDGVVTPSQGVAEGPIIELTDGGKGPFEEPVAITVHFTGGADFVPMLYDISPEGKLSDLQLASLDTAAGTATFVTFHASAKAMIKAPRTFSSQQEIDEIDTGYRSAKDGFQIRNLGSSIFEQGECLGMTAFSRWYYLNRRYESHGSLYTAFMQAVGYHSYLPGYPPRYAQDIVATRAHGAVQLEFMLRFNELTTERRKLSDQENFAMIRDALWETGYPVMVNARSKEVDIGHSVLVYAIVYATEELGENGMKLLAYDPNFPGQTREILYHKEPEAPDWSNAIFEYYEGPAGVTFDKFTLDGSGTLVTEAVFDDILGDASQNPPFSGGTDDTVIFITSHDPGEKVTQYQQSIAGRVQEVEHNIEELALYIEPLFVHYKAETPEQWVNSWSVVPLDDDGNFSAPVTLVPGKSIIHFVPAYYNWLGVPIPSDCCLRGTGWELTPASEFVLEAPVEPATVAVTSHNPGAVVMGSEVTLRGTITSPSVEIVGLELYSQEPGELLGLRASTYGAKLDDWNKRAAISSFELKAPVHVGQNKYYIHTLAQESIIEILDVNVPNNYKDEPFIIVGDAGPAEGQMYFEIEWKSHWGSPVDQYYYDKPYLCIHKFDVGTWWISYGDKGKADEQPFAVWEDNTDYDGNGEATSGLFVIKVLRVDPGDYTLMMDAPVLSHSAIEISQVRVRGEASGTFVPQNSWLVANHQWNGLNYNSVTKVLDFTDRNYEMSS